MQERGVKSRQTSCLTYFPSLLALQDTHIKSIKESEIMQIHNEIIFSQSALQIPLSFWLLVELCNRCSKQTDWGSSPALPAVCPSASL